MPTGNAPPTKPITEPLKIPQTSVVNVSKEFEPNEGASVTPALPNSLPTFDKLAPGQLCGTGHVADAASKTKETPLSTRPKKISQIAALEACEGGKAHTVNVSRCRPRRRLSCRTRRVPRPARC